MNNIITIENIEQLRNLGNRQNHFYHFDIDAKFQKFIIDWNKTNDEILISLNELFEKNTNLKPQSVFRRILYKFASSTDFLNVNYIQKLRESNKNKLFYLVCSYREDKKIDEEAERNFKEAFKVNSFKGDFQIGIAMFQIDLNKSNHDILEDLIKLSLREEFLEIKNFI